MALTKAAESGLAASFRYAAKAMRSKRDIHTAKLVMVATKVKSLPIKLHRDPAFVRMRVSVRSVQERNALSCGPRPIIS